MINKRINGLVVFLLLLSIILPVFSTTRSSAETTDSKASLLSFELMNQQEQQITTKLTILVPASEYEQQMLLEISDNYSVNADSLVVFDQETDTIIGNGTYQNNQVLLHLQPFSENKKAYLELVGNYQNDGKELSVEDLTANQSFTIGEEELQQLDSIIENNLTPIETTNQKPEVTSPLLPRSSSLTLHAELNETEIIDGTADFDVDNQPGNDASSNNQIVRSFDTITYPIKMTLNDSSGGTLNNIRVKVTGTLHNGIVDGRTNAVFADHSNNDYTNNTVTFEDEYVVGATGNAVTFPVIVNVLGADNGTVLQPEFHVQVLSIDGVDVTAEQIRADFTQVIPRMVSSKVSIAPKISSGTVKFASQTLITSGTFDKNHRTIPLGVELMAVPLPGKTDIKGAAFPRDDLQMKLTITGRVVWDNHVNPTHTLDFNGSDRSPYVVDHHNFVVNTGTNLISSNPNTWSNSANVEYRQREFNDSRSYWAGSKMTDKPSYNEINSIWDSGSYQIDQYDLKQEVTIDVTNYQIGATYPVRRADGYAGRTVYSPNEKVFTNQNVDVLLPNDYAYQRSLNPDNYDNTLYYKATLSYTDQEGAAKNSSTEFTIRNEIPGIKGTLSANFKNPDTGLAFGKYSITNDIDPYGDGQAVSGAKVALSGGGTFGDTMVDGGYQYLQKWNTDAFQMKSDDFIANEALLQAAPAFGSIGLPDTGKGYWYGISKKGQPNTLENLKTANVTDYDWYDGATIAANQSYEDVGAVLIDRRMPIARTWKYNASNGKKGVQLTIVTEKLGARTQEDTPNIYVAEMDVFRDEHRPLFDPDNPQASYLEPSRYSITENYAIHKETKYDENNQLLSLQEPAQGHTKFDTLGIVPVKVSNAIKSDKTTYHSTEEVLWTIYDNGLIASKNYHAEDDIFWTVTLPPGLSYRYGSGKYDNASLEPSVVTNPDKSQTLTWKITAVSTPEETALLKNIEFKTNFDDINIVYSNNVADLTVESIISTAKDTSQDDLRTGTATINVMNIGRLGIYQTITPQIEEVNQPYTLSIVPYSTMREEEKVRGIVPLAKDGTYLSSDYQGQNELTGIQTDIGPGKSITIYLNDSLVTEINPNQVNVSQNGWYLYTGSTQDLSNVQTVLYEYQQKLQPNEKTAIHLTMKNQQNDYGDTYRHQAYGNSLSDYQVPVYSNIVEHLVKGRKINGIVWLDENKDGQMQSSESRLNNVPVSLYCKDGTDYYLVTENLRGESLENIKTDTNGKYSFDFLPAGNYVVSFDETAAILKWKTITGFNTGDPATSSKVDSENQLSAVAGWNTMLSQEFPELEDLTDSCFEQDDLHLGVYAKKVVPPKPNPNPDPDPEPKPKPKPEESTSESTQSGTDSSKESTSSTSSNKKDSGITENSSESSETNKTAGGGSKGSNNIPPSSQISRKDLPATASKRSLLPRTNDLKSTLLILVGVCLLIFASGLLVKQSKRTD